MSVLLLFGRATILIFFLSTRAHTHTHIHNNRVINYGNYQLRQLMSYLYKTEIKITTNNDLKRRAKETVLNQQLFFFVFFLDFFLFCLARRLKLT